MSNYNYQQQQQQHPQLQQPTSPQSFLLQQQNIQAQHPSSQNIQLQPNTPYINNIPTVINNSTSNTPYIQQHQLSHILQPIIYQQQPPPQQYYQAPVQQQPQPQIIYTNQIPPQQVVYTTNQVPQQHQHQHQPQQQPPQIIYTTNQVPQQHQPQEQIMKQEQIEQNNKNYLIESSFQGFLFKIKEKFDKFSSNHVGPDNIKFEDAPLPTHKECNYILLKLHNGRNIHTSLLPFTLPNEIYKPPEFFTKIDIIQFYLSGLASTLILMKLSQDQTFAKSIAIPLTKAKLMIEKLAKIFQQQLDNRNNNNNNISNSVISNSSGGNENNNNNNLSASINGGSNGVLSSQRNNNPIIIYFNQQFEFIQQLKKYFENSEITNECLVYFTQSLFSMLTNQGYFWYIGDDSDLTKQLRTNIFSKIYENLEATVMRDPSETKFKYYFGCYCFSYFKHLQKEHQITSQRFINFKSTFFKPPAKDEEIYKYLLFFLNLSNDFLFKAFINPISDSHFWLIYAKTCCLLDQEEKAHTWIQYYINEATDRVTAASVIQLDEDIAHYHNKSWYIEIMKSIEDEKKKRIQEDDLLNKQRQQQLQQQLQQQQQQNHSPHIIGGQVQDQYSEIKTNLLLEGLVLKSMNHDATLISSNVLLNLHPPLQSKEVEIAQQRLNQRLELYMLKNSKEIPGDGNCQMHALSDQLHGDLSHSQEIRKKIVDWLRKNKDFALPNGATICQFVNTNNWDDYCNDMSKNGNWGDHLTLLAAAELFGSKISIISSVESQSNFFIEIIPTKIRNDKVLLLSHYAEFHYGSLCPLR